jgi:excisionase family DNA binding protein
MEVLRMEKLLTRDEVAERLGYSLRTVASMLADGRLRAYRVRGGRRVLIPQSAVNEALERR